MNSEFPQMDPLVEKYKDIHPQRNTFVFDKVSISSDFDSGNMSRCVQLSKSNFNIYMSEDCQPYNSESGNYRTWFYFSVTGVQEGESLTFTIKNMNNQGKLYKSGLKPVFRVLPNNQSKWKRIPNNVSFDYGTDGFYILFSFLFNFDPSEIAYFAFSYPFSNEESLKKSEQMLVKYENSSSIYFKREVLYYSLEGREVELLTLTGTTRMTEKREERIDGLFPLN